MGFPFFMPAYLPGNRSASTAATTARGGLPAPARRAVASRWISPSWRADIRVRPPRAGPAPTTSPASGSPPSGSATPATPTAIGSSATGKSVVYSTDSEHKLDDPPRRQRFADFFRDADLVIFDAHVLAGRRDLDQGGLGALEQRGGRRAVPDGAGPAPRASSITSRPTTMPRSPRCWPRRAGSKRSRATATPCRSRRRGTDGDRSLVPHGFPRRARRRAGLAAPPRPVVGFLLVVVLAAICAMPYVPGLDTLRLSWFDVCQRGPPRARASGPGRHRRRGRSQPGRSRAVAVAPHTAGHAVRYHRGRQARGRRSRRRDAGPDRLSPQRLPALIRTIGPDLAAQLAALPSNDAVLAAAIRGRPVVLATRRRGQDRRARLAAARTDGPVRSVGGDPAPLPPPLRRHAADGDRDRPRRRRLRPAQRRSGWRCGAPRSRCSHWSVAS